MPTAEAKIIEIENIVVSGFIVKGHSLVLPEAPVASVPAIPPRPPTEPAGTTPPETAPAPPVTPPAENPAQGAEGAPAPAGTAAASSPQRAVGEENPEQQFEKRLQTHDLFDGAKTRIISYPADVRVPNLKTFTMQIMLKEPMEIKYNR